MANDESVVEAVAIEDSGEESQIDVGQRVPQGEPCEACGAPVEPTDRFCPACGNPHASAESSRESQAEATNMTCFRCENCGSEVFTEPDQRSYVCPFCDSTYVVELPVERSGRQRPEFVIGFAVTPEEAQTKFRQWLASNGWFRPGDLKHAQIAEKLRGVYLPFWSFSMLAASGWRVRIGEYWYRTETYTTRDSKGNVVTRTRQVRETEWWPLAGRHQRYYHGYLVSGSRGLSQADAERIKPFNLPALKRYEPYYLAGWLCEEYSVSRDEAQQRCEQEFRRREQANVAGFLPGDTHRELFVQTGFSHVNSDLCLLPVYLLSYRHREKLYRFLVNGQTGKVDGDKPLSYPKIAIAVGGFLLVLLLVILLVVALSGS